MEDVVRSNILFITYSILDLCSYSKCHNLELYGMILSIVHVLTCCLA